MGALVAAEISNRATLRVDWPTIPTKQQGNTQTTFGFGNPDYPIERFYWCMFPVRYLILYLQGQMVKVSIVVSSSREKSYIYGVQLQGLYSTRKVHKPSPWSRHAHPYSHQMLCTDLITKMTKLILTRIHGILISWYVCIVIVLQSIVWLKATTL